MLKTPLCVEYIISLPQSLKGVMRRQMAHLVGCPNFSIATKPSRLVTLKWVVISVSTHGHLPSWVTVWRRFSSAPPSHHTDSFPDSGNWGFLCLLAELSDRLNSHSWRLHTTVMFSQCVWSLCHYLSVPRNTHSKVKNFHQKLPRFHRDFLKMENITGWSSSNLDKSS